MTRAALGAMTRCLAVAPKAMRWGDVDWEDLLVLANAHLLTPALYNALVRSGDIGQVPADAAAYLQHLAGANERRNGMLRDQAREVATALNSAGITPMFLKSTADLMAGDAVRSEDGIVGDIDVLVPRDAGPAAMATLIELGYRLDGATQPNDSQMSRIELDSRFQNA